MINVNEDFLKGYVYALGLVSKGIRGMHEYDWDDRTLDLVEIYVEGLKAVGNESKDVVE